MLTVLTTGYFAFVFWVRREKRRAASSAALLPLPSEDQPPPTAVGWPPSGSGLASYLEEGFAALDAYLAEGFAA